MADLAYRSDPLARRTDWGAIWAGVFVFLSIFSVFGALGFAIFATAASPGAGQGVAGMSMGIGIWLLILTAVSMYVAGRETGRLAGVTSRQDGVAHGMAMFGLSVVGVLLLLALGGGVASAASSPGSAPAGSTMSTSYLLSVFTSLGWIGFISLILGWAGAMWGASQGVSNKVERAAPREIRPAA